MEGPGFYLLISEELLDMFWTIIGGILVLAVGIFAFAKPDLIWEFTERWKSERADEPSDLYVLSTRIGGILLALAGIFVIIVSLFVE